MLRHAPDELTAILASLVAVFATSLLTEQLHGSAVIAVVVAGVLVGHEMRTQLAASRVLALQGFWEVAAFVTNVWLFLLVGIQLSGDMLVREAWPILLAVVALHMGRAVAVYLCFGALYFSGQGVPWRWQHVMVFGNVKGALSMAAVPQDVIRHESGVIVRECAHNIVLSPPLIMSRSEADEAVAAVRSVVERLRPDGSLA